MRPNIFFNTLSAFSMGMMALHATAFAQPASPLPGEGDSFKYYGDQLEDKIEAMDWGGGRVSFSVQDAALPIVLLDYHADNLICPGSSLQLVTAAAALERLDADYRFATELRSSGELTGGTLKGALIVRGNGDPTTGIGESRKQSWALFDRWADRLKDRGIRRIDGPLIVDGRVFSDEFIPMGWDPDYLSRPRLAPSGGLNFNRNILEFEVGVSGFIKKKAEYEVFPPIEEDNEFYRVSFFAVISSNPQRPMTIQRMDDENLIQVAGQIEPGEETSLEVTVKDPEMFFGHAMKMRLAQCGIEVSGGVQSARELTPASIPENQIPIDRHLSPPLGELLKGMLRDDNTIAAESVFKTMGRPRAGSSGPAGFEQGSEAIKAYLTGIQLPPRGRLILDGSGHSQLNLIRTATLCGAMRQGLTGREGAVYASLACRAWDDGNLAERFRAPVETKDGEQGPKSKKNLPPPIYAKAGSEVDVESLAGWMDSVFDRRVVFAFVVNGSNLPPVQISNQLDELALFLAKAPMNK